MENLTNYKDNNQVIYQAYYGSLMNKFDLTGPDYEGLKIRSHKEIFLFTRWWTPAAENLASTPYHYSCYDEEDEVVYQTQKVLVIGSDQ